MTIARQRLCHHLEAHLATVSLPAELAPDLGEVREGTAPYAVRLAREWRNPELALSHLRGVLEQQLTPDPLTPPLLRWGVRLAAETEDDALRERFAEALDRFQARYAAAHALRDLGDAMTAWAVASSAVLQPYAAAEAASGPVRIALMRLRDPISARFESVAADLSEIGDPRRGYREIVIELVSADPGWLRLLDPHDLTLRFVLEDRYFEASTRNGELFDVEVNPHESRVYIKLRSAPESWTEVDSAVIMASPGRDRR